MDLQKVKESLEEIVNQDTGTWDKPVPFSVLHTRSLDIARDALSEFDNTPCLDTETYALKIWEMFEGDCRNGAILLLQQYGESYHAKKCAECIGSLPAFPHKDEHYPRFEKRSGITTDVNK